MCVFKFPCMHMLVGAWLIQAHRGVILYTTECAHAKHMSYIHKKTKNRHEKIVPIAYQLKRKVDYIVAWC